MRTSVRQCCLSLLGGYRYWISPFLRPACRCEPTCSHYASVAIGRYGMVRGRQLATCRLLKCHPFHPGGMGFVK